MDAGKLKKLLAQKEGPKLDYKLTMPLAAESHKKEITKDIIALANTPGGRGYLVIGVRDKTKEIVGVNPDEYPEEKIQQIILNRCEPPITLSIDAVAIQDKHVVVITVYKSHTRPHMMRQTGAFYIRRGSTTDFAHRDEIATMLQQSGITYGELMPIYSGRLDHFDLDCLRAYVFARSGQTYEPGQEVLLADLGIMVYEQEDNRYYPTVGGIMLFGKEPQLLLPHTGIKFIVSRSDGKREQTQLNGPIISLLDQAMVFLEGELKGFDYPLEVLEESICNALVHRDYYDYSRDIVVYIGDKRIEVSNPGSVSDPDPINNLMRSTSPKRHNAWIYHQLLMLDDKHRFTKYGLGLLKIKRSIASRGSVRFVNLKKSNLFKVVLPGRIK